MKISVFTPTNNSAYLGQAYESLRAQTHEDWEWIVLPNCHASVPGFGDPRVKVIGDAMELPEDKTNVGFLKYKACQHCTGEIMVELDHDDFLRHDCLELLAKAFEEEGADFVYSTFAEFHDKTNAPRTYDPAWGWAYEEYEYQGIKYLKCIMHPPEPQCMLKITHGPNHVRSWRSSTYWELGGHRTDLDVGDDYDLYMRFYCAGKKFVYIPECLYFYRWIDDGRGNSTIKRNRRIQESVHASYENFVVPSMKRWSTEKGLLVVDLGGAHGKPDGFIGVDIAEAPGVDIVADLRQKWPFEDSSVGLLRASDFIEHLPDKVHTLNEMWRVMAPGGVVLIDVPSTDGRGAFQDPTHVSFWNTHSMWYITENHFARFIRHTVKAAFWPLKLEQIYPTQWHQDKNIPYVHAHLVCLKQGIRLPQPYPHMDIPD